MTGKPRVLTLDLETAPILAFSWGQRLQNIANVQVVEHARVLSVASKWHGEDKVEFRSEYHHGKAVMVQHMHDLLCEADIVVHFNGTSFDLPWMRTEIALAGLTPPSPVREVDLLKTVRSRFRFSSNKLENVAVRFDVGAKVSHTGFKLWRDCLLGDEVEKRKAWSLMRKYNKGDVIVTEALYDRLLPWIPNHPHVGLWTDEDSCQRCGAVDLVKRGFAYLPLGKYQQYKCRQCGSWSRGKSLLLGVDTRGTQ